MKDEYVLHLQEEQIIWAVVDEQELAEGVRLHLQKCPLCLGKVNQIKNELQELGQKAVQAVPPCRRPVVIPDSRPVAVSHGTGWLPFFGAAAMAALVVFFYVMGMEPVVPPDTASLSVQENLLEDEALMRDISEMVENPLPEDIYIITGEDTTGYDEDFLEFVVPDSQDDFQSELTEQGGTKRC